MKQDLNVDKKRHLHGLAANIFLYPPTPCIIFIVFLVLFFSLFVDGFATAANFQSIFVQIAYIGIISLGLNFVILLGEIDIAVAIGMVVSSYAFGIVTTITESVLLGFVAAVFMGALYGLINGLLIARFKLSSFIVTLATKNIIRGLLLVYFGGGAFILNDPRFEGSIQKVMNMLSMGTLNLPSSQRFLSVGKIGGISVSIYIFVVMFLIIALISRNTNWGRNIYAVGGNKRAAVVAGISVTRVVTMAYIVCGICCGIGGVLYLCQVGQLQAAAANGYEMRMIAACAIGGTSMSGGRGSGFSPFVGAILMGIILNATAVMAIPGTMQDMFLGAIILVAVVFDIVRRKVVDKIYV